MRVPTRLDDVARECLSEAGSALASRGLSVAEHIPASLPAYPLDRDLVKEAVTCLLADAIRRASRGASLRVTIKANRHALMLSVKAPGSGVDAEGRDAAVPPRARDILAAQGGRAWANGLPGKGVTFYLTLPTPDRAAAPPL